jgi:hypothetical protein
MPSWVPVMRMPAEPTDTPKEVAISERRGCAQYRLPTAAPPDTAKKAASAPGICHRRVGGLQHCGMATEPFEVRQLPLLRKLKPKLPFDLSKHSSSVCVAWRPSPAAAPGTSVSAAIQRARSGQADFDHPELDTRSRQSIRSDDSCALPRYRPHSMGRVICN